MKWASGVTRKAGTFGKHHRVLNYTAICSYITPLHSRKHTLVIHTGAGDIVANTQKNNTGDSGTFVFKGVTMSPTTDWARDKSSWSGYVSLIFKKEQAK